MKALLNILWFLDLTPVHFYRPEIANAHCRCVVVHAVTLSSDCLIDNTVITLLILIKMIVKYGKMNCVDTFLLSIY